MRKLYLMKNPDLFQGEKYLKKSNKKNINYFEGWYFKNISSDFGISFIAGININEIEEKAFIQVITNDESWFIDYDISDFEYHYDPFWIKIKNNYFSKKRIHIDIKEKDLDLFIDGDLKYSNSTNINRTVLSPNIMGFFSYISFMECNHGILSMKNDINGIISLNNKKYNFVNGTGYIEKDFGCSFPKNYIWLQGNCFRNNSNSFMLAIADIPFKLFNFRGLICSLIIDDKEYRFATYNGAKIVKYEINNNNIEIILRKGKYYLEIMTLANDKIMLIAPSKGKMNKEIYESISSKISITLRKKKKIIFKDTSTNCGLEIV